MWRVGKPAGLGIVDGGGVNRRPWKVNGEAGADRSLFGRINSQLSTRGGVGSLYRVGIAAVISSETHKHRFGIQSGILDAKMHSH